MATTAKPDVLENVKREIGRIAGGGGTFQDISKPTDYGAFIPAPADSRLEANGRTATPAERGPFGRWLLQQAEAGGFLGQLALAAKNDRGFPRDGDPEAVRKRLNTLGADPDMHEALDDAELDWSSY